MQFKWITSMTRCELAQVDNLQQRSETHGINVMRCELVGIYGKDAQMDRYLLSWSKCCGLFVVCCIIIHYQRKIKYVLIVMVHGSAGEKIHFGKKLLRSSKLYIDSHNIIMFTSAIWTWPYFLRWYIESVYYY